MEQSDASEMGTRLLVSVRDVAEARAAILGGVGIVDVKEPRHGSLGMAAPEVLSAIGDEVARHAERPILSVACGEVSEAIRFTLPADASESALRNLSRYDFAKVGLAGCGSRRHWQSEWLAARCRIAEQFGTALRWAAVIYVDRDRAGSPEPAAVIDAAVETGCEVVLFDTYDKSSGNLFDSLSVAELTRYVQRIQKADLRCALAGRLSDEHIPQVSELGAEIFAVRSAACAGNDREGVVSEERVSKLVAALHATRHMQSGWNQLTSATESPQ